MANIEITITLPEDLVRDARELGLLDEETLADLLQAEIDRREIDAEREAELDDQAVKHALGEALNPDGSIDFDKLDTITEVVLLEELMGEDTENDSESTA